ncbi:MAG: metalloregulator ArsR/SmtB family transcription factor [bacterium]
MVLDPKKSDEEDVCEIAYVDEQHVQLALKAMPSDPEVNDLAETFRSLSDPTRVRIIAALSRTELCVCDLAAALGLTGSAVSHQLRLLRGQRLVKYRKEGKIVYYSLDDQHINNLFAEGMRHVGAR